MSYWALDETSGTRVDAVGDNDLTDNNTVGYDTGKNGNSAKFDVLNSEYLSRAVGIDVRTGDLTIAGWFISAKGTVIAQWDDGGGGKFQFLICQNIATVGKLGFYTYDGGLKLVEAADPDFASEWQFFIAWFDSSAGKIYLSINNGSTSETATTGPQDSRSCCTNDWWTSGDWAVHG